MTDFGVYPSLGSTIVTNNLLHCDDDSLRFPGIKSYLEVCDDTGCVDGQRTDSDCNLKTVERSLKIRRVIDPRLELTLDLGIVQTRGNAATKSRRSMYAKFERIAVSSTVPLFLLLLLPHMASYQIIYCTPQKSLYLYKYSSWIAS